MATSLIRISNPMAPGAFTVMVPGGSDIIAVDALGLLVVLADGVSLPDEPRNIEVINPGNDFVDPDFNKYVRIGRIGGSGPMVYERTLD